MVEGSLNKWVTKIMALYNYRNVNFTKTIITMFKRFDLLPMWYPFDLLMNHISWNLTVSKSLPDSMKVVQNKL